MTDMELAEEIERRATYIRYGMQVNREECEQIIAALRQADLAQTEIKGHMRIKDELEVDLRRTKADLACAEENFHVTNQAYVKADVALTQTQARIAELEKELAWCADHNGECLGDHMQRLNLIRALLKDRA